jgi:hypothetical protein
MNNTDYLYIATSDDINDGYLQFYLISKRFRLFITWTNYEDYICEQYCSNESSNYLDIWGFYMSRNPIYMIYIRLFGLIIQIQVKLG